MQPECIIASYPRSGNHWIRYILEWFSGRPTLGDRCGFHINDQHLAASNDTPIYTRILMPHVDGKASPIAVKRHIINQWDPKVKLICLLRNYKEAITRHLELSNIQVDLESNVFKQNARNYIKILEDYDRWPAEKHLIYYYNIIEHPEETIKELLQFIGLYDEGEYAAFIGKTFPLHHANSLGALGEQGVTGGKIVSYHRNKLTLDCRKHFDNTMYNISPEIFNKYLLQFND